MKTVVIYIMVIRIERGMKRGITIEYLKYRADLNFEVDFGVNGAIGTMVTKWDLNLFGSFSSIIYIFLNAHHMPLIY